MDAIIISRVLDDISHKDFNYAPTIAGKRLEILEVLNHYGAGDVGRSLTKTVHTYTNGLNGYYLRDFLRERGITSRIINVFDYELEALRQTIENDHPVAVVLSTTFIISYKTIKRVIDHVREIDNSVKIVVGGPFIINGFPDTRKDPSMLKGFLAKNGIDQIDYVVREYAGEGSLYRLLDSLKRGASPNELPNIASRESGFVFTASEPEDNDFENHSIQWDRFSAHELTENIPIQAGIGCHGKCKFCSYWMTRGKVIRHRTVDALRTELRSLSSFPHIKSLRFVDDEITTPITRFEDICRMMIAEKLPWKWSCWANAPDLTEEAVRLMKEAGCDNVLMGIESGSDEILQAMAKDQTVAQIRKALDLLHKHDMLSFAYFICGFPGETDDTIGETIALINESGLDSYEVIRFTPYPVLPIYAEREKHGLEGYGSTWKHNTMNSEEAFQNIRRIVFEAKKSAFLPAGMEPLRYLLNAGYSRQSIVEAVKSINSLWRLEVSESSDAELRSSHENNIKRLIRRETAQVNPA